MLVQARNLESFISHGSIGQLRVDTSNGPNGSDKRAEDRYSVLETAIVHPISTEERERLEVYVMDISNNGMKLRVERPLVAGMQVQVLLRDLIILGEVRHCRQVSGRFNVGVLVQDVLRPPQQRSKQSR
ncbi:MAG: PilZ domain-containing protein [Acidobacteriota bacterium]